MLVFINCPPLPGSRVFGWMMLNWLTSLIPSWWPAIEPMELLKEDQITKPLSDVCPLQKFLLLKMPQIWAVEGCLRSCLGILIWKLKVDYTPEKCGHLSLELNSTVAWISPFPLSFRPFTYLLVLLRHHSLCGKQAEGYLRCTTARLFALQLASFALSLFAIPPSGAVREKPNPNLSWVATVQEATTEIVGQDGPVVMGQGLPELPMSAGNQERQQCNPPCTQPSASACCWHCSGHSPLITRVCLKKLKLPLISFTVLDE